MILSPACDPNHTSRLKAKNKGPTRACFYVHLRSALGEIHNSIKFLGSLLEPPANAGTVGMSPPANSWMMALEAELETRARMLVCQMAFKVTGWATTPPGGRELQCANTHPSEKQKFVCLRSFRIQSRLRSRARSHYLAGWTRSAPRQSEVKKLLKL